jgi:deazaflavin-dependent oxidoreductase (nitroreductase family)
MSRHPIRTFNKYVTNRLLRRFAHSSRGPFAVIHHIGRRSGKSYETTIMAWPMGGDFVFALTYGDAVDWYRNLLAAGHGTLLWHGSIYSIEKPEPIDATTALKAFPVALRPFLRMHVRHFVRVHAARSEAAGA